MQSGGGRERSIDGVGVDDGVEVSELVGLYGSEVVRVKNVGGCVVGWDVVLVVFNVVDWLVRAPFDDEPLCLNEGLSLC